MDEAKKYWEERAEHYKTDVRGVLFKKPYPAFVNKAFHGWSLSLVEKLITKDKRLTLLDIACGWGRISQVLIDRYPKVQVTGIDISKPYIKMYNKMLSPRGKGYAGTMEEMPFAAKSFDAAFLIVSLMYLPSKERQLKALQEISRVLKKKGKLLLIERTPLMGIFDITQKFRRKSHKQISFTSSAIHALIKSTGGKIRQTKSWPSNFFPLYKAYLIQKS